MKADIIDQGSYVIVLCPFCIQPNTLFDGYNPEDSAGCDEFEGTQEYKCEKCKKLFEVDFGTFD